MTNDVSQADLLLDAFSRVQESVHAAVEGLSGEQLSHQVDPQANSIGWLVWHLTRVQDDHVAGVAGTEQLWASGWAEKFGLPYDLGAVGYGQSAADVAAFTVSGPQPLVDYYDAVHAATTDYITGLSGAELAAVVDEDWDPPVTLAVRLVSVVNDDTQHVGQAAYVRGLIERGL